MITIFYPILCKTQVHTRAVKACLQPLQAAEWTSYTWEKVRDQDKFVGNGIAGTILEPGGVWYRDAFETGGTLLRNGKGTFSAAAHRFIQLTETLMILHSNARSTFDICATFPHPPVWHEMCFHLLRIINV